MAEEPQDESRARIEGWRDISRYFGRSIRTVQEWEEEGLQIYRFQNRVWAYVEDLEKFRASKLVPPTATAIEQVRPGIDTRSGNPPESAGNLAAAGVMVESAVPPPAGPNHPTTEAAPKKAKRVYLALGSAVGALAMAVVLYLISQLPAGGEPSSFTLEGRLLTVFNEHNRKMWEHVFPDKINFVKQGPLDLPTMYKFVDVDGDGRKELLLGVGDRLYCFRSDGTVAWTYQPGRKVTTRKGQVLPREYSVQLVSALSRPRANGGRIIVGAYLGPGATFVVELLTQDGRKVGEYFHFGWFMSVQTGVLDERGDEDIFLGGVDDTPPAASTAHRVTLVVLNPDKVEGQAATLQDDQERGLTGLPVGMEKAVLLIQEFAPNPDPHLYCRVAGILVGQGSLELHVTQHYPSQPRAHFRFDQHLTLQAVLPGATLEKILDTTVLSRVPPAQKRAALRTVLGNIIYVRNEFAQDSSEH